MSCSVIDTKKTGKYEIHRMLPEHEALGSFVSSCINTNSYSSWPVESLARLFLPPIRLGQYFVCVQNGRHCGFVTWAWVSRELSEWIIKKHEDPRPFEWRSGPELWVMDMVSEPGLAPYMARHCQRQLFVPGSNDMLERATFGYSLRRDEKGSVLKVVRWPGFLPSFGEKE